MWTAGRSGTSGGASALGDCPNGGTEKTGLNDTGGTGPYWFDPSFYGVPFAQSPNPAVVRQLPRLAVQQAVSRLHRSG